MWSMFQRPTTVNKFQSPMEGRDLCLMTVSISTNTRLQLYKQFVNTDLILGTRFKIIVAIHFVKSRYLLVVTNQNTLGGGSWQPTGEFPNNWFCEDWGCHSAQKWFGGGPTRHKSDLGKVPLGTNVIWGRSHSAQTWFGGGPTRHKIGLGEVPLGTKVVWGGSHSAQKWFGGGPTRHKILIWGSFQNDFGDVPIEILFDFGNVLPITRIVDIQRFPLVSYIHTWGNIDLLWYSLMISDDHSFAICRVIQICKIPSGSPLPGDWLRASWGRRGRVGAQIPRGRLPKEVNWLCLLSQQTLRNTRTWRCSMSGWHLAESFKMFLFFLKLTVIL